MRKTFYLVIASLCLVLISHAANAQVRLPRLVRDSMVLQRDSRVKIWGWASAGEQVAVSFRGRSYRTRADAEGNWSIHLAPSKAGGPFTMTIRSVNTITINNILVGDVWLCSGQSNMVHQMQLHTERYAEELTTASYPHIRQFVVPNETDLLAPRNHLQQGEWKAATGKDLLQFSVVAYFFAKSLHQRYSIPIGIINATVGGPPIESWMSEEALKAFPTTYEQLQKNKDTASINAYNRTVALKNANLPQPDDKGLAETVKWFDTNYIATNWQRIAVPGYWEDQGVRDLDGIVWYRKEFEVPAAMTGSNAKLYLGRIVDADVVYVNGKPVGNTSYQYPQRRYTLPEGMLKQGRNVIVVRVTNHSSKGGFVPDKPYCIVAGKDTISLTGYWQYKVGGVFTTKHQQSPAIDLQYQPAALYNAMIAPLANFTIKGFAWYQGEGNIARAPEYRDRLTSFIRDWRGLWKLGDLPFVYVQLPNFGDMQFKPAESYLAVLRQAQLEAVREPNTQMAVTIDLGEWNDIHPGRKKEVGERLAIAARHLAYGEKSIVPTGPLVHTAELRNGKVYISFNHTGTGLSTSNGTDPSEFALAGADKKFVWATARIEGDQVVVWSSEVTQPAYVRYAWADSPVNPNLYNKEGLPAAPFEAAIKKD